MPTDGRPRDLLRHDDLLSDLIQVERCTRGHVTYLRGIDSSEIIDAVHSRPDPVILRSGHVIELLLPVRPARGLTSASRRRCGAASVVSDGGVAERHLDLTTQSLAAGEPAGRRL